MNLFIKDLDHSLRLSGIGDMSIGKHVKLYLKKFYFRISILEKIFINKDFKEFEKYLIKYALINKKNLNNYQSTGHRRMVSANLAGDDFVWFMPRPSGCFGA